MYEITPMLYVGSYSEAESYIARKEGVKVFVVNCTKDLPNLVTKCYRVAVDDDGASESFDAMYNEFSRVTCKMHAALERGEEVIVHCKQGQQRSAAVVAAYIMRYMHYSLKSAIEYIKGKKRDAFFFRANFEISLTKWEHTLTMIA